MGDVALGHTTKMRWNKADKWIWSEKPVHEQLMDVETFERVQAVATSKGAADERSPRSTPRPYAFLGIVRCGTCGRRMQGTWNNDRSHYRCMLLSQQATKEQNQTSPHSRPRAVAVQCGSPATPAAPVGLLVRSRAR